MVKNLLLIFIRMYSWKAYFSSFDVSVAWYLKYFPLSFLSSHRELLNNNHVLINKLIIFSFILLKHIRMFFLEGRYAIFLTNPYIQEMSATARIDLFWTGRIEYGWLFWLRSHMGIMTSVFFCSIWILYILQSYLSFSGLQTFNGPSYLLSIITMQS